MKNQSILGPYLRSKKLHDVSSIIQIGPAQLRSRCWTDALEQKVCLALHIFDALSTEVQLRDCPF